MTIHYGKLNLFPGGAKADEEGRIRFERGMVSILRGEQVATGWRETPHGPAWLIVADRSRWPVMVQLDQDDVARLRAGLDRMERARP